jgi:hypothetical protein
VSTYSLYFTQLGLPDADYGFEKAGCDHLPYWRATCSINGEIVGTAENPGKKKDVKTLAAEKAIYNILMDYSSHAFIIRNGFEAQR